MTTIDELNSLKLWAFRTFRWSSDGVNRYKFYWIYVITLVLLPFLELLIDSLIERITQKLALFFFILFVFIAIVDVVLLIWTAVYVFQISRTVSISEHSRFEIEKERWKLSLNCGSKTDFSSTLSQVLHLSWDLWNYADNLLARNAHLVLS